VLAGRQSTLSLSRLESIPVAQIHESKLSLRISGDLLLPARITKLLAGAPTFSHAKGEEIRGQNTGRIRIARSGMWLLSVDDRSPENLDGQLRQLFDQLTDNLDVWRELSASYSADLFVGVFLRGSNEGLNITASVIQMIADRRLEIGFDIYAGDPEIETPS
jgi:ribosomal protein L19